MTMNQLTDFNFVVYFHLWLVLMWCLILPIEYMNRHFIRQNFHLIHFIHHLMFHLTHLIHHLMFHLQVQLC